VPLCELIIIDGLEPTIMIIWTVSCFFLKEIFNNSHFAL